ncbi:MAG: tetratricopeptide repeat protein [Planctomycetes bacterium]|nr:tetratricopeptide repeat protein [Planctomycetota bacterium]
MLLTEKQFSLEAKTLLFALILVIAGCEQQQADINLDSALKTHVQLIQEGNTGSARVRLRQYMEAEGESSQTLFLMGLSYHHDKQYAKAVHWFSKAEETDGPAYPHTRHFLGWSHFYLGNIGESKANFKNYIAWKKDEPDSLFALGLIATEEGDFVQAEELLRRAIVAAASNVAIQAKAKARLADVFAEDGRWDEAIGLYQEALQQNPDLYEAWHRYGFALARIGKNDEAARAAKQCTLARRRVRPDLYQTTRFPE